MGEHDARVMGVQEMPQSAIASDIACVSPVRSASSDNKAVPA